MGLKNLLTSSVLLRWNEPVLFRVRLRNDLWIRLAVVSGTWLGATGMLLIVFSWNRNPPGAATAMGLGLVVAGVAALLVLGLQPHVSGSCQLRKDKLLWHSTSAGFLGVRGNWSDWGYECIDRCVVIPSHLLGHSFSVMLIFGDGDELMIGLPQSLNMKQLATILTKHGIKPVMTERIPPHYTRGMGKAWLSVTAIGLFIGGIGLAFYPGSEDKIVSQPTGGLTFPDSDVAPFRSILSTPDLLLPENGQQIAPGLPPGVNSTPGMVPSDNAASGERSSSNAPAHSVGKANSADSDFVIDSPLIGGTGGIVFRSVSPSGTPVVGLQFRLGEWAGKPRVGGLSPVFERHQTSVPGTVLARDGYVLAALEVDATDLVNAVRPVFAKQNPDGSLVDSDSYTGDWIGIPDESRVKTISGNGSPVIGVHGRGAAVLDAIGLVFDASAN